MNIDKRYNQNRVRKRTKNVENVLIQNSSEEEERQFKLRRFVEDVNKFVVGNRQMSQKIDIRKPMQDPEKKMKATKRFGKSGLCRNGFQTEFCNRETLKREDTARLDKEFYSIISLANGEKQCQCQCKCNYSCHEPAVTTSEKPARKPLHLLNLRTSPYAVNQQNLTSPQSGKVDVKETVNKQHKSPPPFEELDNKLYPEFSRIVTISCAESKSIQFRNQSYITDVKRRLLAMYLRRKKENIQESSCPSDTQKNSVGTSTSPLENNSPLTGMSGGPPTPQSQLSCNNDDF